MILSKCASMIDFFVFICTRVFTAIQKAEGATWKILDLLRMTPLFNPHSIALSWSFD